MRLTGPFWGQKQLNAVAALALEATGEDNLAWWGQVWQVRQRVVVVVVEVALLIPLILECWRVL
jgi:hypothetical protein